MDAEDAGEDRCCCCSSSTTSTARMRNSTDRGAQGVVGRIGGLCISTTNKKHEMSIRTYSRSEREGNKENQIIIKIKFNKVFCSTMTHPSVIKKV